MAEPAIQGHLPLEMNSSNASFAEAFQSVPLPNFLAHDFPDDLSVDFTLPEGLMADLPFDDDFDFSLDDLLLPSENDQIMLEDGLPAGNGNASGVSSGSNSDRATVLNSPSRNSGNHPGKEVSGFIEGDQSLDAARISNSGDSGCFDAARLMNSPSPESGNSDHSCSGSVTSTLDSRNVVNDQKVKTKEESNGWVAKRKKEKEEGNANPNPRSSKFRRALNEANANSANLPYVYGAGNEEGEKKKTRLIRNRESAQLSRQRKKHYVEELEDKVRSMHATITELNSKISFFMAENASLRQQFGGGQCHPANLYPPNVMPPMQFPWVPCAPYAVKPHGTQVPLVPIPRLKPKQPVSISKAKKIEDKKAEGKTKKVASVSFLGLLFFILIFGGLFPVLNIGYGGSRDQISGEVHSGCSVLENHSHGRILNVSGHLNGSAQNDDLGLSSGKTGFGKRKLAFINSKRGGAKAMGKESRSQPGSDEFVSQGNGSEPLVASLYVPRNDKLVKIDGNLIISSVLASEKAIASSRARAASKGDKATMPPDRQAGKSSSLAIPGSLASAFAIPNGRNERQSHMYKGRVERLKALASGSGDAYKDSAKSATTDGPLQQWFREGLAGPIFRSGMCAEVFQFEIAKGSIVPATSVVNTSAERRPDSARPNKRNRRILYHPPIPLAGSVLNITQEHAGKAARDGDFKVNNSTPSMVVSVLIDPRETGDGDDEGMMSPKSLSRIFVVVLLDSVKYVTYSCVLPLKGSSPHLVAT